MLNSRLQMKCKVYSKQNKRVYNIVNCIHCNINIITTTIYFFTHSTFGSFSNSYFSFNFGSVPTIIKLYNLIFVIFCCLAHTLPRELKWTTSTWLIIICLTPLLNIIIKVVSKTSYRPDWDAETHIYQGSLLRFKILVYKAILLIVKYMLVFTRHKSLMFCRVLVFVYNLTLSGIDLINVI